MKLFLDTDAGILVVEDKQNKRTLDLYSKEAFEEISRQWVRIGWNQKYQYTFTWMGRPVIQLPEDMIRIQEVICQLEPDVIIETGVAHGGSLVFYASLCKAMGKGRVIGIDIDIRTHNRAAIESHLLSEYITLLEGSSTSRTVVEKVRSLINTGEKTLVILDSNHTYAHVYDELECYSGFVTEGSYIVATDGIMYDLADVPRGFSDWSTDNPVCAAKDFVSKHPEFVAEQPVWQFNESDLNLNITHWPGAWLKRKAV